MKFLQILLSPLSILYGLIMMIRNLLFDVGILRSVKFEKAVISVGNLSFGGTGKTPHIEYLVRLLKNDFFIAILSRGYKRETKGFILASIKSNVRYIGDEPLQYVRKFDDIKVAVDENRSRGLHKLFNKFPDLDAVLLDDAFQHRKIKPGVSILLTNYHAMYTDDHVFPAGRLREFRRGARRAEIIIVTKTPKIFSPITRRRILEDIRPLAHQSVFFSYQKYENLVPVYENGEYTMPAKTSYILLFSGIADNYSIREQLEKICTDLTVISFPDHHKYNPQDLEMIRKKFNDLPTQKKVIVTTEKDVMRLKTPELSTFVKNLPLFYLPVEVDFHGSDKFLFEKEILNYVEKNKRNH
jgi:tetraacyldisaccharide 4'-kinase